MSFKLKIRRWINLYKLRALHNELDELSGYLEAAAGRMLMLKRYKNKLTRVLKQLDGHGRPQ